jgi:putative Holliday junction resolvase
LGADPRTDEATVLAFDFGTRKIGVAVGDVRAGIAHPLSVIRGERKALRFAAIAALIAEWRPATLLVGRPVHADGTEHETTDRAERFARSLEGRFGLPVVRVDERYTTQAADLSLAEAGVHGAARKDARDAVAAQLILQSWLDEVRRRERRDPA